MRLSSGCTERECELIANFPTMGKLESGARHGLMSNSEALVFLAIVAIMVALAVC